MKQKLLVQSRALNTLFYCLLVLASQGINPADARRHPIGIEKPKIQAQGGIQKQKGRQPKEEPIDSRYANVGPRPSAWCGWWLRTQKGGGPEYNIARNWAKRVRPLYGPEEGAVVVWAHHVGIITGKAGNGKWLVLSGNDSNQVRERPRTVHDAIAFRRV